MTRYFLKEGGRYAESLKDIIVIIQRDPDQMWTEVKDGLSDQKIDISHSGKDIIADMGITMFIELAPSHFWKFYTTTKVDLFPPEWWEDERLKVFARLHPVVRAVADPSHKNPKKMTTAILERRWSEVPADILRKRHRLVYKVLRKYPDMIDQLPSDMPNSGWIADWIARRRATKTPTRVQLVARGEIEPDPNSPEEMLKAVERLPARILDIENPSRELVETAVIRNPDLVTQTAFVDDCEMLTLATIIAPNRLPHLSNKHGEAIAWALMNIDVKYLRYVPPNYRSWDMCDFYFTQTGRTQLIPEWFLTDFIPRTTNDAWTQRREGGKRYSRGNWEMFRYPRHMWTQKMVHGIIGFVARIPINQIPRRFQYGNLRDYVKSCDSDILKVPRRLLTVEICRVWWVNRHGTHDTKSYKRRYKRLFREMGYDGPRQTFETNLRNRRARRSARRARRARW
jgi:hypothetical protein